MTTPAQTQRAQKRSRTEAVLERFHEESKLAATYDARTLKKLLPFVRPQAKPLGLSMGLLVVSSLLALGRPLVMRAGFDGLDGGDPLGAMTTAAVLFGALIVVDQAIAFPQMYAMQLAGARSMAALRSHVFRFLHTRKLGFFDRTPVGRLVSRVTNDIDAIGEMFASGALNAIGDLIRLIAIVVVMLSLNWHMALIAFVAAPPVALLVMWTRRRIRDAFREIRAKTARMNAYLNEQVSGMAIVQAYAREESAAEEFDEINLAYRAANNRSIVYDATLDASIELISSVSIASALWFAGVNAMSDQITFGTLFAFIAYIELFFVPIRDLSARYTLVQSAMAGAERVFELLENRDEDAPAKEASDETPPSRADLAFELSHVTFEYKPGVPVLFDVSLAAKKGEKIALVGATGAGKSTVASVLLRLYEPQSGTVRVFGKDASAMGRDELRRHFAVVPQDVFLFPGSVASNIAAGDEVIDKAKVEQALSRIDALDLFKRRPDGLDAKVEERGSNFSAGERQLIAFARALYRDPPVLVLDEATANVDSDTEARLSKALAGAMKGRTSLVIAHRLATIQSADRIVVFHKGHVVESGTHDELLEKDGVYARLYRLQFARQSKTVLTAVQP